MRIATSIVLVPLLLIAVALTLAARRTPASAAADGYSHATTTCLQGIEGSGIRLELRQHRSCEVRAKYPYLEIYIRELPVAVNKRIMVGDTNQAFSCQSHKESCDQFRSGEVMFNHFEERNGKDLETDGWYELRSRTGLPETGRFKVDCYEPCA